MVEVDQPEASDCVTCVDMWHGHRLVRLCAPAGPARPSALGRDGTEIVRCAASAVSSEPSRRDIEVAQQTSPPAARLGRGAPGFGAATAE